MVSLAKLFEVTYVIQVGLSVSIHLCAFIQEKLQDKWSWASIVEAVLFALWILLVMVMMCWKIDWIQSKPWVAVAPLILWLGVCGYFKMNALSNGLRILPAAVNVVLFPTMAWEKIKDHPRHEPRMYGQGSEQHELSGLPFHDHVEAQTHDHASAQVHYNANTQNHNDDEAESPTENEEVLSETMEGIGDIVADLDTGAPQ